MKVSVYIEQGSTQLVLTPETEWETSIVHHFPTGDGYQVHAYRGSFYETRGGYWRMNSAPEGSIMLRIDPVEVAAGGSE